MFASSSEVASFYDKNSAGEHNRLIENPVEHAVTWAAIRSMVEELIGEDHQTLRILDIGGGTGRYAVPLAGMGHEVHLSDISAKELEVAEQYARDQRVKLASVTPMDARNIRDVPELFKSGYYDIILCLGPFYHILQKIDREQLLNNLCYITRTGGYIGAAFVTRYAHLRDVASKDPGRLLRERDFYSQYLQDGQYTRTLPMHHACSIEIKELVSTSKDDVQLERMLACESFLTGSAGRSLSGLSNEEFEPWAKLAVDCAGYADHVGAADHILVILKKT